MDENGVPADPTKIQVICNWLALKTKTELHSFLGLINFYHKFVLGLSHIAWDLIEVTKGGPKTKFVWVASQQKSFEDLKLRLFSTLVLILPDLQQPFGIEKNASNYAIDAFLNKHGNSMAYHSQTLSDVVRRDPTYEKEM
jgi:hypothetical protein